MPLPSLFPRDGGAPRPLPLVGHALAMRADPLRLLSSLARTHGGVAPLQIGPMRGHLVSEPALVGEVLVHHKSRYSRRTRVYEAMAEFLGRGILTTEGDDWRIHRRIVQPAFHRKRLASFTDSIVAITASNLDSWRGEIDVSAAMMGLTLRIVSEVLLGTKTESNAEDIGEAVDAAQRFTETVIAQVIAVPRFVPTARNRDFGRALVTLDRVAYEIIDERTRSGARGDDCVSMLLDARYEDGQPLARRRIRDELVTMLAAGHETTSNALSWTLMRLSQHPEVRRRLVAEVDEVLEGRAPSFEDIAKLRYTRWVFDEAMRLHPPVWTTGRVALEPHTLGTRRIEKDDLLILSPYVTHRRADLWDNPEGFDPSRWEALSERGALAPFTFFPFGGGTRKCVGEAFAYLEAIVVLAMIAQRSELHLTARPVVPLPQITLGIAEGLWMQVAPRAPRQGSEAAS